MANKRETSSQRRQRENRARRAALEARTKGAPSRPSRVAPATAEKLARASAAKPAASGAKADPKAATTRSGRPRRERPPKPGDTPVDIATLQGSWPKKVIQVPGGLQVLMAAALAVFVSIMASFTDLYIAEADKDKKGAKATQTIFEANGTGRALLLLGIPLLIVFIAAGSSLSKHRRRIWLGAAVLVGAVFGTSLILYLFVAGTLGWAYFRASKVEGPDAPLFRRAPKQAADDVDADADAEGDDAPDVDRR